VRRIDRVSVLSMESIGSQVIVGYAGQMTRVQFYVI
jgi:hypothetical protein